MCCLKIQVRNGDRLVRVTLGPRYVLPDREAPQATPEQAAALQSLEALLSRPESWPASVWTNRQIRAYVPTSYSFAPTRLSRLASLPSYPNGRATFFLAPATQPRVNLGSNPPASGSRPRRHAPSPGSSWRSSLTGADRRWRSPS
jgi:hypothetical protein